jgi:multisubunit Na+/H+ antiporter MnhC subunit
MSGATTITLLNNQWLIYMMFVIILIFLGIYCLLTMKNIIKLLIGIEVFSKGISLAIISTGFVKNNILLAQSIMITFIVIEVVVVAVALGIIINIYKHTGSLDIRKITNLKG